MHSMTHTIFVFIARGLHGGGTNESLSVSVGYGAVYAAIQCVLTYGAGFLFHHNRCESLNAFDNDCARGYTKSRTGCWEFDGKIMAQARNPRHPSWYLSQSTRKMLPRHRSFSFSGW